MLETGLVPIRGTYRDVVNLTYPPKVVKPLTLRYKTALKAVVILTVVRITLKEGENHKKIWILQNINTQAEHRKTGAKHTSRVSRCCDFERGLHRFNVSGTKRT